VPLDPSLFQPEGALGEYAWKSAVNDALTHVPEFNVKSATYGAAGDGVADDTAELQATFNAAAGGGMVIIPPGTYKISSTVTIPAGVKIKGAGRDLVTIDGTGVANQTPFFRAAGALTVTTSNLTANVSPEALTATVASGTGFAAGDYVRIESTASTGTDGILAGEILRIYSIASNVLTFDSYVMGTYTTAATGKVTKLTMIDGVEISDIGFLGTVSDATKQQIALEFDFCINPAVRRVRIQHCHRYGVELWNCLGARVEDSDFYHCSDATYGYAVCNDGATADSVVTRNNFRDVKAAVEHTGSTGAGNGGVARRCIFSFNTITGAYRGAMQAHTGAEDLVFIGNTVASTTSNEISGGQVDGMNVWGTRQTIIGNVFTGMFRRCIYTGNGTTSAPFRILIQGNTCRGASLGVNYGSGIEIDVSNASGGTVEAVSILGNQLKMDTTQNSNGSIRIIGLASGTSPGWIISNNDMISAPQFPAIIANNLSDFTITGNHLVVPGTGSNGVGIQIDGSADGVICGNVIVGPGSGTGVGVQAANTSGVAVTGNRVRGFFNGVKTTGTSTGWSVAANVLTGFVSGGAETSLIGTNTVTGANV
jgi:hypothetical protein